MEKSNIKFDAVYTGYLGSTRQIDLVAEIFDTLKEPSAPAIVDPAMADNGKLYPGVDNEFIEAMKTLVGKADYILPNITEAALLTDSEYKTVYDKEYIDSILEKLMALGTKNILLTGGTYKENKTGVVVFNENDYQYYEHAFLSSSCHGIGVFMPRLLLMHW